MNIQELTQQRLELLDAGFETKFEARIQDRELSRGFEFTIKKAVKGKTNPSYARQKVTASFESISCMKRSQTLLKLRYIYLNHLTLK
jgi:hypothetical protein